jgi:hypothetical protein
LAGSTLYGGVVNGLNTPGISGFVQNSWYAGATLATPVTGLKLGAAFDYMNAQDSSDDGVADMWAVAGYASFQATEKLSLHARGEWFQTQGLYGSDNCQIFAATATIQYDLWQNVISRLEFRWDHDAGGDKSFGGRAEDSYGPFGIYNDPTRENAFMLAANVIYKF